MTRTKTNGSRSRRVAIVQRSLRRYREPFYEQLRARLAAEGVELDLVHHTSPPDVDRRDDAGELSWSVHARRRTLRLKGIELVWQQGLRQVRDADLVIVEQATSLLANYLLLARQAAGGPRVAFWGHGRNFAAVQDQSGAAEAIKRLYSRRAHWWFAYNRQAADVVVALGYPPERVTEVRNAIDTRGLANAVAAVDERALDAARAELGVTGRNMALFVGNLSSIKGLSFLLKAGAEAHRRMPDFELVVVGGGPDKELLAEQARQHQWLVYAGQRFGKELAPLYALAKVVAVPGWAGLVVVDSFAARVPLVASTSFAHPPEMSYLEDGHNGLVVDDGGDARKYAVALTGLLADEAGRQALVSGCRQAAETYTIENMVDRFHAGVLQALES